MDERLSETLLSLDAIDYNSFTKILDGNSQCYKFYWLEALIKISIRDCKKEITFDEAADEMIISAWYTVTEFHLHMGNPYAGKQDVGALEKVINRLQVLSELSSSADESDIRRALIIHKNEIDIYKEQLIHLVPYKLLSPYIKIPRNVKNQKTKCELIKQGNSLSVMPFPYIIEYAPKLAKSVIISDQMFDVFSEFNEVILGWINYKKIQYLQDRNPGVPGIVYKINRHTVRNNLGAVRNLWKEIMKRDFIIDIFTARQLDEDRYDIDHFIPWSYVATDELWNLSPISKTINIQKSNKLPDWDTYFPSFLDNQFKLYKWKNADLKVNELFVRCQSRYLNSTWANVDLYNKEKLDITQFGNVLYENMKPIYKSAALQGFEIMTKDFWK